MHVRLGDVHVPIRSAIVPSRLPNLGNFKGRHTGQPGVSLWKHGPAVALRGCWLRIGRVGVGGWGATTNDQWCGFEVGGFCYLLKVLGLRVCIDATSE